MWSCDRQTRKSVVASSLDELRAKGAAKLGYNNLFDLKIVLEIDGTEVEDETYFQRAEKDTVFLMLQPNEKWLPPGVEALRAGMDFVDGDMDHHQVFTKSVTDPVTLLWHLQQDSSKMMLFTEEQLELVANVSKKSINPLDFDLSFVDTVMDACGRLWAERREAQEAKKLIKAFLQSGQSGQDTPNSTASLPCKEKQCTEPQPVDTGQPGGERLKPEEEASEDQPSAKKTKIS